MGDILEALDFNGGHLKETDAVTAAYFRQAASEIRRARSQLEHVDAIISDEKAIANAARLRAAKAERALSEATAQIVELAALTPDQSPSDREEEIGRLRGALEQAADALGLISRENDADNPLSWRCDSREDCLDLTFASALEAESAALSALSGDRGEG